MTPFGTQLQVKKQVDIVDPFSKPLRAGPAPIPFTTVLMVAIAIVVRTILIVTGHHRNYITAHPENLVPVVVCVHHLQVAAFGLHRRLHLHHLQAAAHTVTSHSSVDMLPLDAPSVICVKRILALLTPAAGEIMRITETVELSGSNPNAGVIYAASLHVAHRAIPAAVTLTVVPSRGLSSGWSCS